MDRGYVKLWRKSLDSNWLKNHKLWAVWTWCLMKASHEPYEAIVGFQRVPLASGQFVFGRNTGALELGMTVRSFRTCIQTLANMQNVTIKSTNKFSVLTVINWDSYQGKAGTKRPAQRPTSDQQVTSKRPASDHIQELKHINTEALDLKTKKQIFDLPTWIDSALWADFLEVRKALGAANTPGAIKRLITTLTKYKDAGHDTHAIIGQSIERSWKGLFEVKDNGSQPKKGKSWAETYVPPPGLEIVQ